MNYRQLGRTGLMVSEIGFGGEWITGTDRESDKKLLKEAEANGINILDCWMANPDVRSSIGEALEGSRDKWIIQGHIGSVWRKEINQYAQSRDLNEVKPAFEDLLARLRTDYIDLGMMHFIDSEKLWDDVQTNGFVDYVKSLKAEGRIHHIGLSTHNPIIGIKAAESGFVDVILFSLNPAFDLKAPTENIDEFFVDVYEEDLSGIDPVRARFYQVCEREGVAITVMKPFAGGRLLDASTSQFGAALTPVQCIHYCLDKPGVAAVMCGYTTPEHVRQAVRYNSVPVGTDLQPATEEEKDYATVLAGAPKHAFSGQCTYCGHCSPCPMGIEINTVNKYFDLAKMQDEIPDSIRDHYASLDHHAGECVGCRSCESRCPFNVVISERMKLTAELFGL